VAIPPCLQQDTSQRKDNAAKVIKVIEAMLKTAKEINKWDDARFRQLQHKVEDCHTFVKQVKDRLEFRACIESFKLHFTEMELDNISKEQKINLVAVYLYGEQRGKRAHVEEPCRGPNLDVAPFSC
jgi:hypothetical protein